VRKKTLTALLFFRYRLALGILAMLSLISFLILQENVRSGQSSAAVVNISGRQRMLSQRIALFSLRLAGAKEDIEREKLHKSLKDAIGLMERSQNGLLKGDRSLNLPGKKSDEAKALYFSAPIFLDAQVRKYIEEAKALLEGPDDTFNLENHHLKYILEASKERLIKSLDSAVTLYQQESEERNRELKTLQFLILLITLSVISVSGYFIFRPMARRVQTKTEALEKQTEVLERRSAELISSNEQLQKEIDERKEIGEKLVAANELNDVLLKTIPFGIDIVDEEGNLLYLNDKMKDVFGEETLGEKCYHLYKDDRTQCENCPLKDGIQLGRTKGAQVNGVMGGKTFLISHTGMIYQDRKAVLEIFEDITDYKKTQERLAYAERLAVIGRMANVIAHEFRNQLGVIRNAVYFLKMKIKEKDEKVKRNLAILDEQVSETEEIIENILTFSRTKQLRLEKIDLKNLLESSIAKVSVAEGIVLTTQIGQLPMVEVDPLQMGVVFVNIILNALQAMGDSGKLLIQLTKEDSYVMITFSDTGKGIKEEDKIHLFEPFFSTRPRGIGLGLATTKVIVDSHGGSIRIESEYGKGTSVVVRLPLKNTDIHG
jgi:PAS domain S-box-containing protein